MEAKTKLETARSWKRAVPEVSDILRQMQEKSIVAVGVAPYVRLVPALFLENYSIFCTRKTTDIDVLRKYATVHCLEERFPKVASKVHSTGYLLRNYAFQAFLKSRKAMPRLMLYQTTQRVVDILQEQGIEWIGNSPATFKDVLLKADFRDLVKKLGLPHLQEQRLPRTQFLSSGFLDLFSYWKRPVVVQRADFDVGGEQGTFFVKNEEDLLKAHEILADDERFLQVQISPFIEGQSVSMLGCVTDKGVLTSPLQLQLIDVPEALQGQLATGVFLGHDWGVHPWDEKVERAAQEIVESIGEHLSEQGYKGIFGIDFIYEEKTGNLFPLECNPRFTGALPVYSLMIMEQGMVPPMEFFHIASHLGLQTDFDFAYVNEHLKDRMSVAHISLTPKGISEMRLQLGAGVYSLLPGENAIRYERPGALLSDIHEPTSEFLMIDSVPNQGAPVIQNVPRFFKLIFAKSIAKSSGEILPEIGNLLNSLAASLRKNPEAS